MVIVRHPASELFVQRVGVGLTDPDDCCADLRKPTYKIALRWGERRLYEHDVHVRHATARGGWRGGAGLCARSSSKRHSVPFDRVKAQTVVSLLWWSPPSSHPSYCPQLRDLSPRLHMC